MAYRKVSSRIRPRYNSQGEITSYQVAIYFGKKNGKNQEVYFSSKTYDDAEKLAEIKKAEYILEEFTEPTNMTVRYYLEREWFPNYVDKVLKPTSIRAYENHMKYINEMLGAVKLQKLTTTQIQQMYVSLMQKSPFSDNPLSYRTVLDVHRTMTSALNVAKESGYIKNNPTHGTKLRKPSNYDEVEKKMVYNQDEVRKLMIGIHNTDMEMPLRLILEATLRRGEALGLLWSDVDFEAGTINVNKNWVEDRNNKGVMTTPKTKSSKRLIKLTPEMVSLLKKAKIEYMTRKLANKDFIDSQRVISQPNGKEYTPKSFYQKYKRTVKKIGLYPLRLHDLRHTGITLQLENGANIKAVSTRAGHSSIKITGDIYGHCTQKMENETVDILEKVFDATAANQ